MQKYNYSSQDFESRFTYTGTDLGAVWTPDCTRFRVWAPTASSVQVQFYQHGRDGVDDSLGLLNMTPAEAGTWTAVKEGNLHGTYYTYLVTVDGIQTESCDPYARATGVNGKRGMILDLASTNPTDWDSDRCPHAESFFTDAVIYELHLRDLSCHPSSGIKHAGKFLSLTETGTKTPGGCPTGLDHIQNLGITHIHLLPFYDYGSVDESHPECPQFNWGYDPVNYNVPEGSYATDPENGAVRIAELKQLVQTLHAHGLGLIMDVVYNHVYDADQFCMNRIVPGYFSRTDTAGQYSNGSGCGNDTASERSMVRKYIVDSVKYWAEEYHLDGFRFDLVGLLDTETVNEIVRTIHRTHPNVLFYGEGWSMDTQPTKTDVSLATQKNASLTPDFSYFNDTIRDAMKGTVFSFTEPGFITGAQIPEEILLQCFRGMPDWCPSPIQSINYVSCHDNMTLFDRILSTVPHASRTDQIRMNNLAAAFSILSQGVPFFQAGEEMLRSKKLPDGSFSENSYNLPDSVNALKWDNLDKPEYQAVSLYYQGLIAFRKEHPALRLTTAREAQHAVTALPFPSPHTAVFQVSGNSSLILAFHAGTDPIRLSLPDGRWSALIDGDHAGTRSLGIFQESILLTPISCTVLERI